MKLLIDEAAVADIDALAAWVAKDSPRSAREIVTKILEAIERLQLFPTLGHPGTVAETYERGVSGTRYVVVYELHKRRTILIVTAVFHTARDQ